MALAQGLGEDVRQAGMVLLADLRLHAELAMLHDVGDVCPGVQELVEAHRAGSPSVEEVRNLVVAPPNRPYDLLLGVRRARFWPTLRPQAFAAAFDSLERSFRAVVADVDADVEGEDDGGSVDVEERNTMARTAVGRAHVVFAVGQPTLKGVHSLVRVVDGLLGFGVSAERIVPVLNRAPRGARARAAVTATFADLVRPLVPAEEMGGLANPIFLPERRIEEALRDGVRLLAALVQPLTGAVRAVSERAVLETVVGPMPVRPGTLGRWTIEAAGS
jgi:hypothetical protein